MTSLPQPEVTGTFEKITGAEPWTELYQALHNKMLLKAVVTGLAENPLKPAEKCLEIMFGNIRGIIPENETGLRDNNIKTLRTLLGRETCFKVAHIYRGQDLVVLSRRKAVEEIAPKTWTNLELGQVVEGTVMAVVPNMGAIVDIGMVDAFLPIKELGWGWVKNARDVVKINEKISVKVIRLDKENKVVHVSLKEVMPDPWLNVVPNRFKEKGQYVGRVCVILENGVLVEMMGGVNLKAMGKTEGVEIGAEVVVHVDNIDVENRKMWGKIIHVI